MGIRAWFTARKALLEIEAVRVSAGSYWVWQVSERKKSESRGTPVPCASLPSLSHSVRAR